MDSLILMDSNKKGLLKFFLQTNNPNLSKKWSYFKCHGNISNKIPPQYYFPQISPPKKTIGFQEQKISFEMFLILYKCFEIMNK